MLNGYKYIGSFIKMVVFRETKTITVTKCIIHLKIFNSVIKQSLHHKLLIQFYGNLVVNFAYLRL